MKLTKEVLIKKTIIAANKMALPLEHYIKKQAKSGKLDDEDVLHLTLSVLINVIVKAMFDLKSELKGEIDLIGTMQYVSDKAQIHFTKMNAKRFKPKKSLLAVANLQTN